MVSIIGGGALVDREWEDALELLGRYSVDSGYEHPAEQPLRRALRHNPDIYGRKLLAVVEQDGKGAAELVWLSGRLPRETAAAACWSAAWAACCAEDIELRDAGVRAFEAWGDGAAVPLLRYRGKYEPRGWLRDYAAQVAQDLSK